MGGSDQEKYIMEPQAPPSDLPHDLKIYLEGLISDTSIRGIILFGSWARGNNRLDSDVDLVVISQNEVKREIGKAGAIKLELVITTETSAKSFWDSHRDDCADLWSYAKIIYDRDGAVEGLREYAKTIIAAGKPPVPEWQIRHMRYDCEDTIDAAEQIGASDPITAALLLNQKIFSLSGIFFDLRREWTPPPKQRMSRIKELCPDFYRVLTAVYSFDEKMAVSRLAAAARELTRLTFDGVS